MKESAEESVRARLQRPVSDIDLRVFTPRSFEAHAAWGSDTAWDRYAWAIARFVEDRSGGALVAAAREKGLVPGRVVDSYIDRSLDW